VGVLTVSGNEITDAVRAARAQGDGRLGDSSFGIWIFTTNVLAETASGFEGGLTGWSAYNGATVVRSSNTAKFGSWSLLAVSNAAFENGASMPITLAANTTYTVSGWLYGDTAGYSARLQVNWNSGGGTSSPALANNGTWQYVQWTFTSPANGAGTLYLLHNGGSANGVGLYLDGVQIENQAVATPYTTGSRAAARVQAPASLLGPTGWAAFRFRTEWASTSFGPGVNPLLLSWQNVGNDFYRLYYDTGSATFILDRAVGGTSVGAVASAVQSFGMGTLFTIIAKWDTANVWISVNGGPFVGHASPASFAPTTLIDIGSINGTSNWINAEILWGAFGVGTLTDTDAANIHANGNTDPVLMPGTAAGSQALPTAVWPAVTSTYNDFAPVGRSSAKPYTVLQVVGEGRLAATGNEITDLVRAAALDGDGALGDSSYGVWEATTNLLPNGGFEVTSTGWVGTAAGAAVARDTSQFKFGGASGAVTTDAASKGGRTTGTALAVATYTASVWVRATAGHTIQLQAIRADLVTVLGTSSVAATGGWQRVRLTFASAAAETVYVAVLDTTAATTFWIDGAQLEQMVIATPYVRTNGATASRAAGVVRAAASLLSATQGWAAFRVRPEWANTALPGHGFPALFEWAVDDNNRLVSWYSGGQWLFRRVNAGALTQATVADAFAAGTLRTVVLAWEAGRVRISLNGAAFVNVAGGNIPNLAAKTTWDILAATNNGTFQFDGEGLWVACGTGTLTDADAATLNALGNTDPTVDTLPPASVTTMVWSADTVVTKLYPTRTRFIYSQTGAVGRSAAFPYTLRVAFGKSYAVPYTIRQVVGETRMVVTGNEITDAVRLAGVSGDGRTHTNLLTNGDFETDASGWTTVGGTFWTNPATITRDTSISKFGSASLRVDTPGALATEGTSTPTFAVAAGTPYTFSLWANIPAGRQMRLGIGDGTVGNAAVTITGTGQWARYSVSFTPTASGTTRAGLGLLFGVTAAITFWIDGAMAETGSTPSTFVPGAAGVLLGDSSYGIWEATTNLHPNGSVETDMSSFTTSGGTVARDTTLGKFGSSSILVPADIYRYAYVTLTLGVGTYTFSVWRKTSQHTSVGGGGAALIVEQGTGIGTGTDLTVSIPKTNAGTRDWERIIQTFTVTTAGTFRFLVSGNYGGTGSGFTSWDGFQVEQKAFATPYTPTTRGAGGGSLPASLPNLTQGWVAARFRAGKASNVGTRISLATIRVDANNGIRLYHESLNNQAALGVTDSGTSKFAVILTPFAAGDEHMFVGRWTAAGSSISVDGSPFTTPLARGTITGTPPVGFDIGNNGTVEQLNGELLWLAYGNGTLTDADAAYLNSLGNSDPTIDALSDTARTSVVWTADTPVVQLAPTRARFNYSVRALLGRSLQLRYGVTTPAPIPGKSIVDAYADGASNPFGFGTVTAADLSIFATYFKPWRVPLLEEIEYARLPFRVTQDVFGAGSVEPRSAQSAVLGWHGLRTDPERGAVAVVQQGGKFTSLVGERVKITVTDAFGNRRAVYVYVNDEAILADDEDMSVPRRTFLALAPLTEQALAAFVEVME
jgi:hypothetical protein